MNLLIGVLAFIGAMCIISSIILFVILATCCQGEVPEYDDDYSLLRKENEYLKEQLSKFQARELSRKLNDVEVLDKMFEDLEREELIFMNT